jgi:hypothetical protein
MSEYFQDNQQRLRSLCSARLTELSVEPYVTSHTSRRIFNVRQYFQHCIPLAKRVQRQARRL